MKHLVLAGGHEAQPNTAVRIRLEQPPGCGDGFHAIEVELPCRVRRANIRPFGTEPALHAEVVGKCVAPVQHAGLFTGVALDHRLIAFA